MKSCLSHAHSQIKLENMCVADLHFLPRLRLLRYCLRLTFPSWLGVTWPTSRATAVLSPMASMPTHTDCTFNTSTDTWR